MQNIKKRGDRIGYKLAFAAWTNIHILHFTSCSPMGPGICRRSCCMWRKWKVRLRSPLHVLNTKLCRATHIYASIPRQPLTCTSSNKRTTNNTSSNNKANQYLVWTFPPETVFAQQSPPSKSHPQLLEQKTVQQLSAIVDQMCANLISVPGQRVHSSHLLLSSQLPSPL